jgi:hypothetical protein
MTEMEIARFYLFVQNGNCTGLFFFFARIGHSFAIFAIATSPRYLYKIG